MNLLSKKEDPPKVEKLTITFELDVKDLRRNDVQEIFAKMYNLLHEKIISNGGTQLIKAEYDFEKVFL